MIRKVEKKDFKQVQNLFKQLYKIYYINRPDIFYDKQILTAKYFQEILSSNDLFCYVFEEQKEILGVILFKQVEAEPLVTLRKRTTYQICDLVVDVQHRFQHIGKSLYDFVEKLALQNDIDAISSNVWAFSREAIKFYEDLGLNAKQLTYEKILNKNFCEHTVNETLRITDKVI